MEYTQGVTTESDPIRHAITVGADPVRSVCGLPVSDLGDAWPPRGDLACAECMETLQNDLVAPDS